MPFRKWLDDKRAQMRTETQAHNTVIATLAQRANAAEAMLLQVALLHRPDEFGSLCCHCQRDWPCDTVRILGSADCTATDPLTAAVCDKPEGHVGRHGGMDRTGCWRSWL